MKQLDGRLLGAVPSPVDTRDYNIAMFTPVAKAHAKSFKLKYTEKIKDQGAIGSCVAHSLAYTREIAEEAQTGTFKEFSVGFIYANRVGTVGDIFESEGMIPRDALQNLKKYGDVLLPDFPVNDKYPVVRVLLAARRDELYKMADPYKITSYLRLYTVDEVQTALETLGAVTVMIPVYTSFNKVSASNPVVPIPDTAKETLLGYHEMTIVGWRDDNKYIVLNSYGDKWGDKGKCYLPYDYPITELWSITDKLPLHWAEPYYYFLNKNGVTIYDRQFDDPITRGEVMALLARLKGYK